MFNVGWTWFEKKANVVGWGLPLMSRGSDLIFRPPLENIIGYFNMRVWLLGATTLLLDTCHHPEFRSTGWSEKQKIMRTSGFNCVISVIRKSQIFSTILWLLTQQKKFIHTRTPVFYSISILLSIKNLSILLLLCVCSVLIPIST